MHRPQTTAALALILFGFTAAWGADMECYTVRSNTPFTLSLPAVSDEETFLCKAASGGHKKPVVRREGRCWILDIGAGDLGNGEICLVRNAPPWLNLDDNTPPQALRCELDGKAVGGEDLGWLEQAPRTILLELEDQGNPINERSLSVTVNGKVLMAQDPHVKYNAMSKNRGVLTCDLSDLLTTGQPGNTVVLQADDCAIDDAALQKSLRFKIAPTHTLADGVVLAVDSIVDQEGWREWWVVSDGKVMREGDRTTAGATWQSDKTDAAHWIEFQFPAPRPVGKVEIWWPYYECYRTSTKYEVQTWDGEKWVTQAKADGQKEQQCSAHAFKPVTTGKVRILQAPNGGHPGRQDLMWIAEVKILPE